eukprot:gene1578-1839_t
MSRLAVFLLTACLSVSAMAADVIDGNRQKEFGDITVHYNTLTTSFLTPEMAQEAGIVRSKELGMINVFVNKGVESIDATVTGTIKDLGGKSEMLTFKKITQKGSTLYVAQYPVPQQETKIFTINVETGGKAHGFSFNQELHNAGKLKELQAMLGDSVQLRSIGEFSQVEPEETGLSFVENAILKARNAARISGLPALADDSGLAVDFLGGAPGIYSARYADGKGDAANNAKLLDALKDVPDAMRGAQFVCVLALVRHADDPLPILCEGLWHGRILHAASGEHGAMSPAPN